MLDHDEQLLESVAVRRQRLTLALLFGHQRRYQRHTTGVKYAVISAIIAALICAGCVGFSFVMNLFAQEKQRQESWQQQPSPSVTSTSTPSPDHSVLPEPRKKP